MTAFAVGDSVMFKQPPYPEGAVDPSWVPLVEQLAGRVGLVMSTWRDGDKLSIRYDGAPPTFKGQEWNSSEVMANPSWVIHLGRAPVKAPDDCPCSTKQLWERGHTCGRPPAAVDRRR